MQPILGHPLATIVIDTAYHVLWLMLLFIVALWHALGRHSFMVRTRFFVSFILILGLLGNLVTVLLSSAGPCYFDRVTGLASPYSPLFA